MARIDLGKVTGLSAYEIAKKNGFEGTEQEWLDSLNGSNYDDTELRNLINEKSDVNHSHENYVEKVEGKELSSNDFTDEEKNKLSQLNNYDDTEIKNQITDINKKIPTQATEANKLADKDFVNSSIATATAEFIGTYNSLSEIKNVSYDNNDYCFIVGKDSDGNTKYSRYKYNGSEWIFEYDLNNSSFTSEQWKAINSGITSDWKENVDSDLTDLLSELTNKSDSTHTHDDRYYTESEIDTALNAKADNNYKDIYGVTRTIKQTLDKLQLSYTFGSPAGKIRYLHVKGYVSFLLACRYEQFIFVQRNKVFVLGDNYFSSKYYSYLDSNTNDVHHYFELRGYNDITMQVLSKSSGAIVVEELTELPEGITLQTYTDSQRIAFNSTFNNYAKKTDLDGLSVVGHNHSNKVNYKTATMVGLGFEKDTYVSVRDFWQTLYEKCGSNGIVNFDWANASAAYVGTEKSNVYINGGTLIYSMSNKPAVWNVFSALYVSGANGQFYHIKCSIDANNTVGAESWFINGIAKSYELANKIDKDLSNVTGTLPISNGGTGATTAREANFNILNDLYEETSVQSDNYELVGHYVSSGSTSKGALYKVKFSTFWDYIKDKISSVLGLTKDTYSGKSAKATSDENGVNIASNYARKPNIYQNPYKYVDSKFYFYWYKILDGATLIGTSGRQVKLKVYNLSDINYPYRAEFTVDVTSYLNDTSKNISVNLINHYMTNENHGNLCVAVDSDFNVYFQTNCLWGSSFSVETVIAVGITPTQTKLNYSTLYQDPTDFVSVKKIIDNGKFKMAKNISTGSITFSQEGDSIAKITATKATNDSAGNKIVDTYATKTELSDYVLKSEIGEVGGTGDSQSNTHYFKRLGDLKADVINERLDDGSVIQHVYKIGYAVIPILELTSGVSNGYSNGRIFNHAKNGGRSDYIFEWKCNKKNDEDFNLTIYNNRDYDKFEMCTFLYEGKKYLGITISNSTIVDLEYYFDGYSSGMDSPLFTIIEYQKNWSLSTVANVINSEIKDSLTTLTLSDYIPAKVDKTGQVLWSGILNHADDFTSTTDITLSKSIFYFNMITIAYRAEMTTSVTPIATAIYPVCGHQQFQSLGAWENGQDGNLFFANYFNSTSIKFSYLFPNGNTLRIKNAYGAFEILGVYGT